MVNIIHYLPHRWIAVWCTRAKKVFGSLQIINDEGHEEVKVNKGIAIAGLGQPQNGLLFMSSMWLTYHIFQS